MPIEKIQLKQRDLTVNNMEGKGLNTSCTKRDKALNISQMQEKEEQITNSHGL